MGDVVASHAGAENHPGWLKVFIQLMKLRVIVLLQITAVCAILVHDLLSRHELLQIERTLANSNVSLGLTIASALIPSLIQIPAFLLNTSSPMIKPFLPTIDSISWRIVI